MPDPFAALCVAAGLPEPEPEYRFAPPRRWRFDWAWPEQMVAVEREGGVWTQGRHCRPRGYKADMVKYSEAAIRGWCVLRFATEDLATPKTLDMIQRAMKRRNP